MQPENSSKRGLIGLIVLILLAVGAYFAWTPLRAIYFSGVPKGIEKSYLLIPTGSSFEQVVDSLKSRHFIEDEASFRWLAEEMKYKRDTMKAGRYEIEPGWSNRDLISHLRLGKQAPVKVILNNERLPEEVAGKVARFIEADSLALITTFRDSVFLAELGYNPETLMSIFIPNTYEMYWNTDAKGFVRKMLKEHEAFWDKNDRRAKIKALNLNEEEAYTLASIVERESNSQAERPIIAGVYLNRLKIGMRLQADPTSVFATRDFATHRVTEYHTSFDSPYNTYVYKGLPPGPISMASISSLEAVINPQQHDYLYFCAKPDDSGTHAFAVTYAAHLVNAERFQAWLRVRGN